MSHHQNEAIRRIYRGTPLEIATAETEVIDCRGAQRLVVYFAGTCTATPRKDAAGAEIVGAPAALSLTDGTPISVDAPFYEIAPAAGDAEVYLLG